MRVDDPDAWLVRRALDGHSKAFEALVHRHREKAYRLLRRLLRDRAEAEDALQDTFLHIYRKLESFRQEARFTTWMYRVATNLALSRLRHRRRRPARSLEEFLPRFDGEGMHADPLVDRSLADRIEERMDTSQLAGRAVEALEHLPSAYRTAFVLRDLEELSTAEAAQSIGINEAQLRQRLHRARLMLRGYLASLTSGEHKQ